MSHQAKIYLVSLTPKELTPYKISHISHSAFKYSVFRLLIHSKTWHIQNWRHSKYWESLKCSLCRTICDLGILTTLVYSSPGRLRAQGIFRNLSNMYDELFSTEHCVTGLFLVFSELKAYLEPCQIFMMESFLHNLVWPQHI